MATRKKDIDTMNSLLRGELAATETYQQALDKVTIEPLAMKLRRMHHEHREAANKIRQQVHALGGNPVHGSGAWGAFAKAIESAAKIFGDTAAMRALKEGEETGLHSYEDALDKDIAQECKMLIRANLLPQTREHIQTLEQLIESR